MSVLNHGTGASVSLESVLRTEELKRRPSRPPDYQAENQALLALAQELTTSPGSVLQRLVDIALALCRGHSAGISLLEEDGPPGSLSPRGNHFRWRNPLAPIRNAVEILRRPEADEQKVKVVTEMMQRQVGQMVHLIDDLLDVGRISRGKIELRMEPVELASIVHHAVEAVRPLCESMDHELTVTLPSQPAYLKADLARLSQVVGNLLTNACKFTKPGGRIWLDVEREGNQALIRVRDTGIGIAAEHLPHIFEMFMQADTSFERSRGGLGVGLTLVKTLVEMHDGTVEARSAGVGRGSEFVVRLPLRVTPAPALPRARASIQPVATAPRRILVVDDDRDSVDTLAILLKVIGHEVHIARDGLEAIKVAATCQPHVILLDIGLPRLNGYEAARRIREQQRPRGVTLVALTGWGQEEDRRRSEEAGFDAHLIKPVDFVALTKLLAASPAD
jgi:CheY-like chemotaxis protein